MRWETVKRRAGAQRLDGRHSRGGVRETGRVRGTTGRREFEKSRRARVGTVRRREDWKTGTWTGRLDGWKARRLEDWKAGRLEGRKTGGLEG